MQKKSAFSFVLLAGIAFALACGSFTSVTAGCSNGTIALTQKNRDNERPSRRDEGPGCPDEKPGKPEPDCKPGRPERPEPPDKGCKPERPNREKGKEAREHVVTRCV